MAKKRVIRSVLLRTGKGRKSGLCSGWRIEGKGLYFLRAFNICLEEDEEEDMFVILEGFVEKKGKKKTDFAFEF